MTGPSVAIVIPCHVEDDTVDVTVSSIRADEPRRRIVVCVNGPGADSFGPTEALTALRAKVVTIDQASKAAAWNQLRGEKADVLVFCDADVILRPRSIAKLVAALVANPELAVAAGAQEPMPPQTLAARVASLPFRLPFGGVAGTLYAARRTALPESMPNVLLDDAWVAASVGHDRVERVPGAVAVFHPPETWRDLWRQRIRAEAGKRQLKAMGLPLTPPPTELSVRGVGRGYSTRDWPLVAVLAAIKGAAALRARLVPVPAWQRATTTKGG